MCINACRRFDINYSQLNCVLTQQRRHAFRTILFLLIQEMLMKYLAASHAIFKNAWEDTFCVAILFYASSHGQTCVMLYVMYIHNMNCDDAAVNSAQHHLRADLFRFLFMRWSSSWLSLNGCARIYLCYDATSFRNYVVHEFALACD